MLLDNNKHQQLEATSGDMAGKSHQKPPKNIHTPSKTIKLATKRVVAKGSSRCMTGLSKWLPEAPSNRQHNMLVHYYFGLSLAFLEATLPLPALLAPLNYPAT
jgi:hypothetical protein